MILNTSLLEATAEEYAKIQEEYELKKIFGSKCNKKSKGRL
ncbi:hypothetical protein E6C60_0665 [Paenibacillus algicola]|uniref:Uncharacterized protein n=1 Tax=Paenibacillus algicola TaxID=2565926 RepID=A0A4P8XG00_9BACL|nr:hypothetical protein E6C60_0665 [Paenibacillus algicola]